MADNIAKVFKALSDETRLDIVRSLAEQKENACSELSKNFEKAQPTLSHHFNKLIDANVIEARKEGVHSYYKINNKFLKSVGIDIKKILATK